MLGMMANTIYAQDETKVDAYFTTSEMPDMTVFMPGPPDNSSVAFANDVNRYFWGKEMRKDPERAAKPFLIVPIIGAMFADLINTGIITLFLNIL